MPTHTLPQLPSHLVPREALQARLDGLTTPVIALVAGPGWGKSTALAQWARRRASAWVRLDAGARNASAVAQAILSAVHDQDKPTGDAQPSLETGDSSADVAIETLAAELAATLRDALAPPAALVLDEADHLVARSPGARLIDALVRQLPDGIQVATACHDEPALDLEALRARAAVAIVGVDELRLDAEETRALVTAVLEGATGEVADAVHRLTGGWPEATRLIARSLGQLPPDRWLTAVESSGIGGQAIQAYVRTEVLPRLSPDLLDLLRFGTASPTLDADLCRQLGARPDALERLSGHGVLLHGDNEGNRWVLSPVVEAALHRDDAPVDHRQAYKAVVTALSRLDRPTEALEVAATSGEVDLAIATLAEHASVLTRTGQIGVVIRAAERIPPAVRPAELEAVVADAHTMRSEWVEAAACLRRAAPTEGPLPARLRWRNALLLYLRWQIPEVVALLDDAGEVDPEDWESSVLHSVEAFTRLLVGQLDDARAAAKDALAIGTRTQNPYALIGAHSALAALATREGDRIAADRHHADGMAYVRATGTTVMALRLGSNRISGLAEQGRLREALAEGDELLTAADRAGHAPRRLLITANVADIRRRLGDLAVAEHLAAQAVEIGRAAAIGLAVYPQLVLADVHLDRAEVDRAAALYTEVAQRARDAGDAQALVLALAGVARVTTDADAAHGHADEAAAAAVGTLRLHAHLARAWTAVRLGDRAAATADAELVQAEARRCGTMPWEAGSHEVLAAVGEDPAVRARHLRAAAALHRQTGAALDLLRVELAHARTAGDQETAARLAAVRAATVGDRVVEIAGLDQALAPPPGIGDDPGAVRVFTFGGFAVHRGGNPISTADWGSRKPRELLQVLLSRRGQRVPRGALIDALWPDEGADRMANRLSGTLSALRSVLDPDKVHTPDHFVVADPAAVWLDLRHLDVDLQRFREAVTRARAAVAAGEVGAEAALDQAVALYAGEFLADVPYDDWTTAAREEARAAHITSLRTLVELATRRGDHDAAIRSSLRLLAEDPYDEDAYRQLIGICSVVGRHGEAQRHYRQYVAQMRRLDVPPMPFPGTAGRRDVG